MKAYYTSDVNIDPGKVKSPYIIPMYTKSIYSLLGMIVTHWGQYDVFFSRLLEALIIATGETGEPHWKTLDYRRRRKLCRKLVSAHLANESNLRDYLLKLLDESAETHINRNAIAHGKIASKFTIKEQGVLEIALVTSFRLNGKECTREYTEHDLETISNDILHLAGRLMPAHPAAPVPGLSSHDTHALAALLSLVPPETILPTPPDPRRASEE